MPLDVGGETRLSPRKAARPYATANLSSQYLCQECRHLKVKLLPSTPSCLANHTRPRIRRTSRQPVHRVAVLVSTPWQESRSFWMNIIRNLFIALRAFKLLKGSCHKIDERQKREAFLFRERVAHDQEVADGPSPIRHNKILVVLWQVDADAFSIRPQCGFFGTSRVVIGASSTDFSSRKDITELLHIHPHRSRDVRSIVRRGSLIRHIWQWIARVVPVPSARGLPVHLRLHRRTTELDDSQPMVSTPCTANICG